MNSITPSTPITPIDRVAPPTPPTRTQAADPAAPASGVSTTIDMIPTSPPDEVLSAMGAASSRYDELAAQNQHVGFQLHDDGGRVQVQVSDLQGNVVSAPLAPSSVFNVLEGTA